VDVAMVAEAVETTPLETIADKAERMESVITVTAMTAIKSMIKSHTLLRSLFNLWK
jgi:hypothetical protein